MGSWGPGLYQDDAALDLKGSVALLSQLPADGDRILEILLAHHGSAVDLTADGGPTFWLVVADQFERKGLRSSRAFSQALLAIERGDDIRHLRDQNMGERDLKRRQHVLTALQQRLANPRPERRPPSSRLPPPVVLPGEVYSFPTMNGGGINPWGRAREPLPMNPDFNSNRWEQGGWGAFLVLQTGRAYDWFPWCHYAQLSVPPDREATLAEASSARVLCGSKLKIGVPRSQHLKRIRVCRLGHLPLDPAQVARLLAGLPNQSLRTPEQAVQCGISIELERYEGATDHCPLVGDLLA